MRRLVGVLRQSPEEDPAYAPMPGFADIGDMVERTGERVRLESPGEVPEAGAATQLTVYRVVQEALTNFLKHAEPAATAIVQLAFGTDRIVVTVVDDGLGAASQSDGLGHGLKGMRERVGAMGGIVEAGPLPERAFRFRAEVPTGAIRRHRSPDR